jgi:hypothetical protein
MENTERCETQVREIHAGLNEQRRRVHGLLKFFSSPQVAPARPIKRVRNLYRYRKVSQILFDLAARFFLNFGSWSSAVGFGLYRGFEAFQIGRMKFEEESKLRPPIFVTETQARKDLEKALAENVVRWVD